MACVGDEFYSDSENFLKGRARKNYEQPIRLKTSVSFVNKPFLFFAAIREKAFQAKCLGFANDYLLKL
jgi:hypothetical protein